MSRYDLQTFGPAARSLLRRSLQVTLATNSIKLGLYRIGASRNPYIWVDPPWVLYRDHELILASHTYPRAPHRHLERAWLDRGRQFCRTRRVLLGLSARFDATVRLRFDSGWELRLPGGERDRDAGQWYDDWYAQEVPRVA